LQEGAGWRDVFNFDAYFQSERYQSLLAEFPNVCAPNEAAGALPNGRVADAM